MEKVLYCIVIVLFSKQSVSGKVKGLSENISVLRL